MYDSLFFYESEKISSSTLCFVLEQDLVIKIIVFIYFLFFM